MPALAAPRAALVATFLFHHFLGESDPAWLRQLTQERLSDEEARALVFLRELGAIDNAAYRTINQRISLIHLTLSRSRRDTMGLPRGTASQR